MREFECQHRSQIEYPDFLKIMTTKITELHSFGVILKAFTICDEDSIGRISLRNLRRVARKFGDNELKTMIDGFYKDGDFENKEKLFQIILKFI